MDNIAFLFPGGGDQFWPQTSDWPRNKTTTEPHPKKQLHLQENDNECSHFSQVFVSLKIQRQNRANLLLSSVLSVSAAADSSGHGRKATPDRNFGEYTSK